MDLRLRDDANRQPDGSAQQYEERNVLPVQLFDPKAGTIRKLAKTTVSRGLHGNALLLPDASVMIMGDDRINLVPPGDRAYPPRDPDWGVATGQLFKPPYLFQNAEDEAERPIIVGGPDEISYRQQFDIRVAGSASRIKSASIIRTDFDTHSLESGEKYVKLHFRVKGKPEDGVLRVDAPAFAAQALQGHYMLYVKDDAGVPSIAKHVRLKVDNQGRPFHFVDQQ